MKQKEINSLKRHFTISDKRLCIEKFAKGVVVGKDMKHFKTQSFGLLEETEQFVYMKLLKESLGGKIGKALLEYPVPAEKFDEDGGISALYDLNSGRVDFASKAKEVMLSIVEASQYDAPVCVTIAEVIYNVPEEKGEDAMEKDDEFEDGTVFRFLLCGIVPLNFAEAELYYNDNKNELLRRKDEDGCLVLEKKPTDVIMYPVLNDGAADVNYVLYKTKDPKHPNVSIIEDFLGCNYTMSGVDEQARIVNVLCSTFGEDIDYEVLSGIKEELRQIEENDDENPEVTSVGVSELSTVLSNIGCDEKQIERFEKAYRDNIGEESVKSVNVMNTESTTFKTSGIKITVKAKDADKVSIERVNGVRCLVVEIDETVKIDDIIVKV